MFKKLFPITQIQTVMIIWHIYLTGEKSVKSNLKSHPKLTNCKKTYQLMSIFASHITQLDSILGNSSVDWRSSVSFNFTCLFARARPWGVEEMAASNGGMIAKCVVLKCPYYLIVLHLKGIVTCNIWIRFSLPNL